MLTMYTKCLAKNVFFTFDFGKVVLGFSVLIHPILDHEIEAHTTYATWLGVPLELYLDKL